MTSQDQSRSFYDVLHVSRDAPVEIIRSSYRTLMQRLKKHPDLGGDAATAALINEAYAVLSKVERRAEYDALLDAAQQVDGHQENQPNRTPDRQLDPLRECVFCKTPHNRRRDIDVDANCAVCASPACPAENPRLESIGKRTISRISKRQDIMFYTHWPQSQGFAGRSEDVSLSGMRFLTNENLGEGQYIKIVGNVIEAIGDVIHCSKIKRRGGTFCSMVGISFVTVRFVRSVGAFVSDRV